PILSPHIIAATFAIVAFLAALKAYRSVKDYRSAPDKHDQLLMAEKGSLFVTFPAISRSGLFCQAQTRDRYVLRWLHGVTVEDLSFDGQAFHPIAPAPDGPIYFELVSHATSTMMRFDPVTRKAVPVAIPVDVHPGMPAVSPDGRQTAFTASVHGSQQIFIKNNITGEIKRATGGNCNNSEPAWELDNKAIVFASDCGRLVGLPVLYRMNVQGAR